MDQALEWTRSLKVSIASLTLNLEQENIEEARGDLTSIYDDNTAIRSFFAGADHPEIILPFVLDAASFEGEVYPKNIKEYNFL